VTVEMPLRLAVQGLQKSAVTQIDQVAFPGRTTPHKQGKRQERMPANVVATLRHRSRKSAQTIEKITDRIMLASIIIAGGQ